eukprot:TRINITY_DN26557_c0_g1_i3.p1 TRINITY_DN26557_c0_g1~~TRINITY_DN26557_c0_g1_i3.p1  ORF type:complete len:228 (-),score=59.91 TRINITY_DN26557_c0_g1_i3:312-995(-)
MSMKVGMAGMGQMGAAMSANMIKAGIEVVVWNRTRSRCEPLAELGADVADTPEELYLKCDLVINLLSTPEVTEDFYKEVVVHACSGKMVIESATVGDGCTQLLAKMVTEAGGRFLEAPVAGHSGMAVDKTIDFLCAGDNELFESAKPVLSSMSKGQHYFGTEVGSASRMKLVVNSMLGTLSSALAEALALADKCGIPQEQLMGVLDKHPMGSPFLKVRARARVRKGD